MKGFLFYIAPVALLLFLMVNFFVGEPKYDSLQQEAVQYRLVEDYPELERCYRKLIAEDSFNLFYHYEHITAHFNQDKEINHVFSETEERNDDDIFNYYGNFLKSDSKIASYPTSIFFMETSTHMRIRQKQNSFI